jgi:hypothetical protein
MQVSIRQVWDQHPKFRVSQCFGESLGATAHRLQWDAEYSSDTEGSTIAVYACRPNIEFISARNMTKNNFLQYWQHTHGFAESIFESHFQTNDTMQNETISLQIQQDRMLCLGFHDSVPIFASIFPACASAHLQV